MSNMSYCRFENTYRDLMDCYYNMNGKLSESETKYREELLDLCQQMLDEYDPTDEEDEEVED